MEGACLRRSGGQAATVPTTFRVLLPDRLQLIEQERMPDGTSVTNVSTFNGSDTWTTGARHIAAGGGDLSKAVRTKLFRTLVVLLPMTDARHPLVFAGADGNRATAGRPLAFDVSGPDGFLGTLQIDAQLRLPVELRFRVVSPIGGVSQEVWEPSDYRVVSGVRLPFKLTKASANRQYMRCTVHKYTVNAGVETRQFERR